jgi:hypothetical protein
MVELDEELTKVIDSLTDTERSVLEGLEGFDFLNRLSVVLVLKGWKAEEIADLTVNQMKKLCKDIVIS